MSGDTFARPEALERCWKVAGVLTLPAAAMALGAMFALWASAGADAPTPPDEVPQYDRAVGENIARPVCLADAVARPHPARGANAPLRFQSGQPRDLGGPCRNAS
jgi:hypothetical protein